MRPDSEGDDISRAWRRSRWVGRVALPASKARTSPCCTNGDTPALIGVGCSNIAPVLFTAAGRQQRTPSHVALPLVLTLGYTGLLTGPAAIGFVAHWTSLGVAFLCVAALLLAVTASSRLFGLKER